MVKKMKKIINIALIAAVMSGAAVTAQAGEQFVHMYGASAQRNFWKLLGPDFMTKTVAQEGLGCGTATVAYYYSDITNTNTKDSNKFVVRGTACAGASGDDVYITYNSVASNDGIRAAKEVAPINADSCTTTNGNAYRTTVDKDSCYDPANPAVFTTKCSAKTCSDITLGTSDVEGSSFVQKSHGNKFGHVSIANGLNDWQDIELTPEDTTGLKQYKPTIVPFAFFANNNLPLTNLTRPQAVNLFGGNISRWGQFVEFNGDATMHNKGVQLCFRHAGSGTHATLDKAVMRGDLELVADQLNLDFAGEFAEAFFYTSSSSTKTNEAGMKECIQTNAGRGMSSDFIAIGYLDADDTVGSDYKRLSYQGVVPSNVTINNGTYDFWAAQNVYVKTLDNTGLVPKMMNYASKNVPASYASIWSTAADLDVAKSTDASIITFPSVPAL
jgi:hypothetical protein